MNDIYTTQRQRWIKRLTRKAHLYDWFRALLIILAGVWLLACNITEVAGK